MGAVDQALVRQRLEIPPHGFGGDAKAFGQFRDSQMRAQLQFKQNLLIPVLLAQPYPGVFLRVRGEHSPSRLCRVQQRFGKSVGYRTE